jgi:hypothetical protein
MAKKKRRQSTGRVQDAPKIMRSQEERPTEGGRRRGMAVAAICLGLGLATLSLWRGRS